MNNEIPFNGLYLTPLHEDKREIVCIKNTFNLIKGDTYYYIKCEHKETGTPIWMVFTHKITVHVDDYYFYTETRMNELFDTTAIKRDDKLQKLLGDD